ncbi:MULTISPECIES: ScbR family autoregulator-binding transcription factor [Streptomyces]|uniref:TetR/AcrR family transcriptional regulator n=1 Tax=Streptomyces formicae TaxID=1616117 RepID=A0ABY3WGZ0_9ACTN|nr:MULTISPECIES: ScbR family autoregulator-binding transcription factor [Streptomyces]UNM11851.1 TetR/AcrR family transcriptional regulator [Streptomyces formicae]UUN29741.1 TetR/AcrR family transcriptional regulator [Streptomyces sp. FIT100]
MATSGETFGTPLQVSTKELKQERAVRTRERVLTAAAQAFAAKGYPAVTILDVAQSAGMTKGAVYFHYENKDALAVAVTDLFYRRIAVIADSVEELGLPPVSSVAELLIRTAVAFRDETVLQAGARLQLERQLIGAQLPLPYEAYTNLITSWLARRAEAGGPGDIPSPATLATVLVSAFFGAQHISWVLNNRADLLERTLAVVRTIIPWAEEEVELCPSAQGR